MIQKRVFTIMCRLSSIKIPRPRDPTMGESFQTKISQKQVKILLDPRGFMSQQEKIQFEAKSNDNINNQPTKNEYGMEAQYGFKPKGPQPTRYGDWEIKGKCVDF